MITYCIFHLIIFTLMHIFLFVLCLIILGIILFVILIDFSVHMNHNVKIYEECCMFVFTILFIIMLVIYICSLQYREYIIFLKN